ncbi:MAG: type II toxin-antitoxin system ParD family antitoxin [Rhodospirillaceae bacterium]|nr:type II toxin-antitoxin system ParD family antitoxin [Rhodospirillaceae bacterium]
MPTMNINLTDPLSRFVDREVATGDYQSASELVRDALRLLQRAKETERAKLKLLKQEVAKGLDDIKHGRFATRSLDEIANDVLARARHR